MNRKWWMGLLSCLVLASAVHALPCDLYISPTGQDQGPGTKTQPFLTVEAARTAIRQSKLTGQFPPQGVTVWIAGGDYFRTNSWELSTVDSGTPTGPVVYRCADKRPARFIGGKVVVGFQAVTDPAIRDRLDPSARTAVVQADLIAQGISDFGKLHSRGFTRSGKISAALEVFYADQPMPLARWPNATDTTISGFPKDHATKDPHGGALGELEHGFYFQGDRPQHWKTLADVWMHGYWAQDWADTDEQVSSIDLTTNLVKTLPPYGKYGFRQGQRFYFFNILEELDQPGEWYLDRTAGHLYFWPPGPLNPGTVLVSTLSTPLLSMANVSYVTVRGLTFECARGAAVEIIGGTSNVVSDCSIRNLGTYGVVVQDGSYHTVNACEIQETGEGGIMLVGGDRMTLKPGGHQALNNHIHDFGRWCRSYRPAVMIRGVGNRVAHNLIHDGPHNAIQLSGNEHLIEFNEIHHVCTETGDVGAFYMGRDWTQRGNVVRYNYFHDLAGRGLGAMAVYLDDMTSGTTVFGNIFYKAQHAVFIGGGRDNLVENNIFVDCEPAVHVDARGVNPAPAWHNMVYDEMRQHLDKMQPAAALYNQRYPHLTELPKYYAGTNGIPPEGNVIACNIQFEGTWLNLPRQPQLLQGITVTNNLTEIDPHFVDRPHGNFRLQPSSPAFKLGFQQIPLEKIGPQ